MLLFVGMFCKILRLNKKKMGLRSVWEILGYYSGILVIFEKLFMYVEFEVFIYICSVVNKFLKII